MRLMRLTCLVLAALAPGLAWSEELPAAIAAFAAEQSKVCTELGGTPRVGPAFATAVDLNGDEAPDYIVDLAGIECANAWSAFCGSAGCPVSVWITGSAGPVREWDDYAQGWRLDGLAGDTAVVVDRHGAACPGAASGAEICSERLTFDAPAAPAETGAPTAEATPEAAAADIAELAPAPRAAPTEALEATGVEGWSLRAVPDGTPVAVTDGPGAVATMAVFCLGGQPWLAARLGETPAAETAELAFAFSGQTVSSAARREDSAGGALIVELADRPLAGLLSGRDSSVRDRPRRRRPGRSVVARLDPGHPRRARELHAAVRRGAQRRVRD